MLLKTPNKTVIPRLAREIHSLDSRFRGNDTPCKITICETVKYSFLIVSLSMLFLSGCATGVETPLLHGVSPAGTQVCFDDPADIPSFFEQFYKTRDLGTEEGKIDYLLERVAQSDLAFIRNEVRAGGRDTANYLRWKLDRLRKVHKMKIETAEDFVNRVTSGSRMSGKPYAVVIPEGGGRHDLQRVLQNELAVLHRCLEQKNVGPTSETQVLKGSGSSPETHALEPASDSSGVGQTTTK